MCLSLAIASVGRAMQRQSDNRHHLITQVRVRLVVVYVMLMTACPYGEQGVAFLSRYRELRGDTAEGLDEVEYNFGRVFQQLGSSPNSLSVTVVCVFDEPLLLRSMQASIHSLSATTSGYCKPLKRGQRRTLRCVLSTSPPCLPHVVFRMSVWRVKPPIICLSST